MRIPRLVKIIPVLMIILFPLAFRGELTGEVKSLVLEDFEYDTATLFKNWLSRDDLPKMGHKVYSIRQENGNRYLHSTTEADSQLSLQIGKLTNKYSYFSSVKKIWDIKKYPYLSWRWRVLHLPTGGDEMNQPTNDSGGAIYVVFQKVQIPLLSWKYQPANWIKYVWSTTRSKGLCCSRKWNKFGLDLYEGRYVVVESGKQNLGKWKTEKINVLADYRKYFGKDPAYNPILIGILSDSNDTRSLCIADYDDITVLSE